MGIKNREAWKGLLATTLLVAGSIAGVACGGDDSSGSNTNQTPIDAGGSTSSGGSSSGNTSSSGGSSSGNTSSSGGSSGTPSDAGADVAPLPGAATPTFMPGPGVFTNAQTVSITSTTPNNTIFYTLDGTNPTTSSQVYSAPLAVAQTTTIRAIATATGFAQSAVAAGTFTINIPAGTTLPVTFSPSSTESNNPIAVGLSTQTSGATICYTTDGVTTPTCANGTCSGTSATYNAGSPIPADAPVGGGKFVVKALACKTGNTNSDVLTSEYTFQAAQPSGTPNSSEVAAGSTVTIATATANSGINQVQLRYTKDSATDPTCLTGTEATAGQQAFNVTITQNTTYRVIACRTNYVASEVRLLTYTVRHGQPTLDNTGEHNNDVTAAASHVAPSNGSSVFCWGTGGTMPSCNAGGTACGATGSNTAPVITTDNTTVNVISCSPNFTPSPIRSGVYRLKVAPIAINPFSGAGDQFTSTYYWNGGANQAFTLTTGTNNTGGTTAQIRWSINGATPTCSGTQPGGVTIDDNNLSTGTLTAGNFPTIKAIGCKAGYQDAPRADFRFADPDTTVQLSFNPSVPTSSDNDISVVLDATPSDATICYASGQGDPTDPDCDVVSGLCSLESMTYNPLSPPVISRTGDKFEAIACKSGVAGKSSPISRVFNLKIALPFVTDSAGNSGNVVGPNVAYGSKLYFHTATDRPIAANCTTPGSICFRYRLNNAGATLSCTQGTLYNPANGVDYEPATNGAQEYRIIACEGQDRFVPSDIATYTYNTFLNTPAVSPNGGSFNNVQSSVTLSAPGSEYMCYTTDGTTPACIGGGTCTGTLYAGAFSMGTNGSAVNAVACRTGFAQSALRTSGTFNFTVANPSVNVGTGSYTTPQSLTLQNGATDAVNFCWSDNGAAIATDCTSGGTIHCTARTMSESFMPAALQNRGTNFELRMRACKAGFVSSAEVVHQYTFSSYSRTITIDGNDDWVPLENGLPTENGNTSYLAWDGTYIYVGWRGNQLIDSATRYLNFYFRGAGGSYTTTRDNVLGANVFGDGAPNTDPDFASLGGVNYHLYSRTNRLLDGVSMWNGATWVDVTATTNFTCAHGGGLADASALTECRIARSVLNLGPANSILNVMGFLNAAGTARNWSPWNGDRRYWQGNLDFNIPTDSNLWKE